MITHGDGGRPANSLAGMTAKRLGSLGAAGLEARSTSAWAASAGGTAYVGIFLTLAGAMTLAGVQFSPKLRD